MKNVRFFIFIFSVGIFCSCDGPLEDAVPSKFFMIQVNPDDVYLYNTAGGIGVRLDPLLNDSIKVDVTVSFSKPLFGTITFIQDEGWFYKPNTNFIGIDNVEYSVCYEGDCYRSNITIYVEPPYDPENCSFAIQGETIETSKDAPIAIRIFANDTVCPYQGSSLFKPEKGNFETYSYSGSFKNIVYVYYPPKGFTGTDKFRYRLFTNEGFLEAICVVNITP